MFWYANQSPNVVLDGVKVLLEGGGLCIYSVRYPVSFFRAGSLDIPFFESYYDLPCADSVARQVMH
jgi:hypothetical protein